ncbi:MAG: lamin tail domain-containing protein [Anaerolineales bacterium]
MGVLGVKWKVAAAILGCFLAGGVLWVVGERLPREISICELQGTSLSSPFQDDEVFIRGLVSYVSPEGGEITLLDISCPEIGQGSRGVLVSLGPDIYPVQVGDELQVRGTVREIEGETRVEAEMEALEILSLENALPAPADPSSALQESLRISLEDWEGQLVSLSRAVIRKESGLGGATVIIPELAPDPSLGLICFQGDQIELRLAGGDPGLYIRVDGSTIEGLVGLVREDQAGYYLQLIEEPFLPMVYGQQSAGGTHSVGQGIGTAAGEIVEISLLTGTITVSPTPSCTPSLTVIPSPTFYPISLLISEILPNPVGEEPGGEWIEIYNPGGGKLPLDGIKLGDETSPAGKEGMLRFPDGYRIDSGEVMVVANQARVFSARYGFRPDFELSDSDPRVPDLLPYPEWGRSAVQLSNSTDEVLLISPWDQVLDLIQYGAGENDQVVEAPKEGHSLERYPPEQDRDLAGDWRESDLPSPGLLNRTPASDTPSATLPASSTVEATPSQALTETPDWTPSLTETPLIPSPTRTCTNAPLPSSSPIPSPIPSLTAPGSETPSPLATTTPLPSQTATPLPQASPTFNAPSVTPTPGETVGTCTPSCTLSKSLTPTPSPSALVTHSPSPSAYPLTPSSSLSPSPAATLPPTVPSVTTTADLTATETMTGTPLLTGDPPSTPTLTGSPFPVLQINEIHADPDPLSGDSNGDGVVDADDDEFLELVNLSGFDLILDGWEIHDGVRLRYTFPEGTELKASCGVVVFGGGIPEGDFGGSLVFTAGSLGLNNSGDSLAVMDPDGELITSCSYGEEGGQDQSLTRWPELFGELPLVLHSLIPAAQGRLFSPGVQADGMPFGPCP